MITTVYPLRSCSTAWTRTGHIRRSDSEYYRVVSRSCLVDDKASGHECGGAKRMNHGADSFCKTNASRRPEFIKSESEPILHAETHPHSGSRGPSFWRNCCYGTVNVKVARDPSTLPIAQHADHAVQFRRYRQFRPPGGATTPRMTAKMAPTKPPVTMPADPPANAATRQ